MSVVPEIEDAGSISEAVERLRPPEPAPSPAPMPKAPPPRLPHQRVWVALAVAVFLVGLWGARDVANLARVEAGEDAALTAGRPAAATGPDPAGATVPPTTATTATTVPAVLVAQPVAATAPVPATAPPATIPKTTSTTARPATTTTTAAAPRPIAPVSSMADAPGVLFTLSASPPTSGDVRTAEIRLETEFGEARVLRSVRIAFGDGATVDGTVEQWSCLDPSAPNPYVLSVPVHTYAAAGSYLVTATVGSAKCSVPDGAELPEETAEVRLRVFVT